MSLMLNKHLVESGEKQLKFKRGDDDSDCSPPYPIITCQGGEIGSEIYVKGGTNPSGGNYFRNTTVANTH